MNDIKFFIWYPALLFPAIPIMLLVFTNKYTALAMLIRKLHILSYDNSGNYLSAERIQILSSRLLLLRWMQTLSGLSFLINLIKLSIRSLFYIFSGLGQSGIVLLDQQIKASFQVQ